MVPHEPNTKLRVSRHRHRHGEGDQMQTPTEMDARQQTDSGMRFCVHFLFKGAGEEAARGRRFGTEWGQRGGSQARIKAATRLKHEAPVRC